jgi:septal ring-binding cell division protein DamX
MLIFKTVLIATVGLSLSAFAGVADLMESYSVAKGESYLLPDNADIENNPYAIDVHSYLNEKDAIRHVEELRRQEKMVFYFPVFIRGQTRFKVCVGRFPNQDVAEKYHKEFVKRMEEPFSVVFSLRDRPLSRGESKKILVDAKENEGASDSVKTDAMVTQNAEVQVSAPKSNLEIEAEILRDTRGLASAVAKPSVLRSTDSVDQVRFGVQVAAYPSRDLASAKVYELSQLKESARIEPAVVSGKTWYRVIVGSFATMSEAKTFAAGKTKIFGKDILVRKFTER